MKLNKNLVLTGIFLLAAILRFWGLGEVPPSPDWDEAALGYNAYSIMKTGRDEYGAFLPLVLRSFDDYKPAIYAYLAILPIKLFGLNILSVRLPAAILGTTAVLLVYLLVKELFKNDKRQASLALLSAFLLAISPWHLQFSRVAFETNIALFFDMLFVWLFLKGLYGPILLPLAALTAGLSFYVYQAEKVFVPLLVISLFVIFWKNLRGIRIKYLLLTVAVGLISLSPFIYLTISTPNIFLRAKGTSFAADLTPYLARTTRKLVEDDNANDRLGLIIDNRRVTYGLTFVGNYLSHFDLNWLFIRGDEERHHAPGMGLLYLWELPFLLWGVHCLIYSKIDRRAKWLILAWFLLAPIPASFSSGSPHAVRSIRMMPMIQIFVALGLLAFWQQIKRAKLFKGATLIIFSVFFAFNFVYFLNQYFIQQNFFTSQSWQYGYKQAIQEIEKIESRYQKIIVSNQPHLDQSYMFFLFYLKFPPAEYQLAGGTVSGGFAETHRGFGKYTFRPIAWEDEEKNSGILYVGRPGDFPSEAKTLKTIYFLDGQPAIRLVEG